MGKSAGRTPDRGKQPRMEDWLRCGATVLDTVTGQTGVVMSVGLYSGDRQLEPPTKVWLRPPQGGAEWVTQADDLEPVTRDQAG